MSLVPSRASSFTAFIKYPPPPAYAPEYSERVLVRTPPSDGFVVIVTYKER